MIRSILLLAASVALTAAAAPVRADEPAAGAVARDGAPASASAPRVRATHRVDVIAPGERVESVIDRMRAQGATAVRDGRPTDAPPVNGDRRGDRGMEPRGGGGPPGAMPAGAGGAGAPTQGPWPGSTPGMGPGGAAPRTDMPPPDRMRHR